METDKRKECNFLGRTYSDGSQTIGNGQLCYCVRGKWERVVLVSGI